MDPITHALSGAVAASALASGQPQQQQFSCRERLVLGGLAALFPDIDFVLIFFVEPLSYLNLHRAETHSLILLPFWSLLLGWLITRVWPRHRDWHEAAFIVATGITVHILGDLLTDYGTQLFAPFSREPLAFPVSFILNPWLFLTLAAGTLATWRSAGRLGACLSLSIAVVAVFLHAIFYLHAQRQVETIATASGYTANKVYAKAAPISPLHWRLIIETDDGYRQAALGFFRSATSTPPGAGILASHWYAFQPPDELEWRTRKRFGSAQQEDFAREAWSHTDFRQFRIFAQLPYLSEIRDLGQSRCAVFADLRYGIAGARETPFRYGMCQDPQGTWTLAEL